MPRLAPSLIQLAKSKSRLLPLILRTCRTLPSAQQELHWIKNELPKDQWFRAAFQRSIGVPLQYIIGTQPFADLEIVCREGVLIPRWETEEWCVKLVDKLSAVEGDGLRMVDICTGAGCVALLVAHGLRKSTMKGIDISDLALDLSLENKEKNGVKNVEFAKGDVFDKDVVRKAKFDLVTANPPYITEMDYKLHGTERSVKKFEPKLALVGGNAFYSALIDNVVIPSSAQGFIFELGYEWQAEHTKSLLSEVWDTKLYYDGAGHPRCVVGWIKGSHMQVLKSI